MEISSTTIPEAKKRPTEGRPVPALQKSPKTGPRLRALRPALPSRYTLLERSRVNGIGFAFGDCHLGGSKRFILPARVVQDVGFGGETSKRRLGLERQLDVLQRLVPVLVGGECVRGLE